MDVRSNGGAQRWEPSCGVPHMHDMDLQDIERFPVTPVHALLAPFQLFEILKFRSELRTSQQFRSLYLQSAPLQEVQMSGGKIQGCLEL